MSSLRIVSAALSVLAMLAVVAAVKAETAVLAVINHGELIMKVSS